MPFVFLAIALPTLSVTPPRLDRTSPWASDGIEVRPAAPLKRELDTADPWTGVAMRKRTVAAPMDLEHADPWSGVTLE
jgi:hypothetical protein